MEIPAISVIIPMYNAQQYVRECLDSLLAQTFQDFEVIVVDDCSTDNSFAVVKNYMPRFKGRLRLAQTAKNSGGGGYIPRNIGLEMATGEYVYFMDADDFILLSALETLYEAAIIYDADVVYFSSHYWLSSKTNISVKVDDYGSQLLEKGIPDGVTFIENDTDKILREVLTKRQHRTPWTKLIRRTILTENHIVFPEIRVGGDALWTFFVYAHAKRFVRLPQSLYFLRRYHTTSIVKANTQATQYDPGLNAGFIAWFKSFNDMVAQIPFLTKNPAPCSEMAEGYLSFFARYLREDHMAMFFEDIYNDLRLEFGEKPSSQLVNHFFYFLDTQLAFIRKVAPPLEYTCEVSVVISLYNYEKYIGECLNSLLAQTFKDFEVIVVDDCSTDNSFAVAESYAPKFGGRLKLLKMWKNTGGGGEPRNFGFQLSHGKYIFFMDADDVVTKTALEEMYTAARNFDADVVYCERYYTSEGVGEEFVKNIRVATTKCQKPPFVDKPTLESNDMEIRFKKSISGGYWVTAWLRLVRRDLLIENNIKFSSLVGSNDVGWSYLVLFNAKRFLKVPNICYVRRIHEESVTFRERPVADHVQKWMDRTIRSLQYMEDALNEIDFFRRKSPYRFQIIYFFVKTDFENIWEKCSDLSKFKLYNIFHKKFGKYLGEQDVLVSCLCADLTFKLKELRQREQQVAALTQEVNTLKTKSSSASISVIISLCNAEQYIGECLDSLLAQTFQDFEVIVIDDCSTDNSVAIVESYMSRFNGQLKLSINKTTLGDGESRNRGLSFSRGDYVLFIDAEDYLAENALETLHEAAGIHDAEVVYTGAYYRLTENNDVQIFKDGITTAKELKDEAILITDEQNKLLRGVLLNEHFRMPWTRLVKRDLLIENQIAFPDITIGGEIIWSLSLCANSRRFVRIPTPIYFGRGRAEKKMPPAEQISYWLYGFIAWLKAFNKLEDEIDFLAKNPAFCFAATKDYFEFVLSRLKYSRQHTFIRDIYKNLYTDSLRQDNLSNLTGPFFFTYIDSMFKSYSVALKQNKDSAENSLAKARKRIAYLEGELSRMKGRR